MRTRPTAGPPALRAAWPELLTLAETAELLGLSQPEVTAAAARGDLPTLHLGNQWRIIRRQLRSEP